MLEWLRGRDRGPVHSSVPGLTNEQTHARARARAHTHTRLHLQQFPLELARSLLGGYKFEYDPAAAVNEGLAAAPELALHHVLGQHHLRAHLCVFGQMRSACMTGTALRHVVRQGNSSTDFQAHPLSAL